MTTEETYKLTVHLTNGKKFKVYGPQKFSSVQKLYDCLGRVEARVKFPVAADKLILMDAAKVAYVEAVGVLQ